jgi:hypothetical protein
MRDSRAVQNASQQTITISCCSNRSDGTCVSACDVYHHPCFASLIQVRLTAPFLSNSEIYRERI